MKHFTWETVSICQLISTMRIQRRLLQIEKVTGVNVNVLILDCEGCHTNFINSYKHKLAKVNKIIFGEYIKQNMLYLLKFPQLKRICLIIIAIKPDWNFKLRISRYFVFLIEADGSEREIEESLEKLKSLGFIENKQLTTGKKNWLGSIIVLTK